MKTKPKGIHATFAVDCPACEGELTITNGRPDLHECRIEHPITLADIRAALEGKGAP